MCLDKYKSIGENGEYTGHDEASVQFISNRSGTGGRELTYTLTLPTNPPVRPNQAGTAGTWELPAAGHLLAEHRDVRHGVVAELHEVVHAEQRLQREIPQHQPQIAVLHRQVAGQRLHGVAVR